MSEREVGGHENAKVAHWWIRNRFAFPVHKEL